MLLEIDAKYYELRYRIFWCIIKMWLTYVRNLNVRIVGFFFFQPTRANGLFLKK